VDQEWFLHFADAGESIEVRSVGFRVGVGVGAREGDSPSVVALCDEAFREQVVGLGEGGSSYVREGGGYALCQGIGSGIGSCSEKKS